jgi:Leucine-rich repeat (LRR) protein
MIYFQDLKAFQQDEIQKFETLQFLFIVHSQFNLKNSTLNSKLISLTLNYVEIIKLKEELKNLTNLKHLTLNYGLLESIGENAFKDLTQIEHLTFVNNSVRFIYENTFENCNSLKYLDASRNKIEIIQYNTFNGLFKLNVLNLSYNKINSVNNLSRLKALVILDLQSNSLEEIITDPFGLNVD